MNRKKLRRPAGEEGWVVQVVTSYLLAAHGGVQADLIQSSGVSRRTISRFLNGGGSAATSTLPRLAAVAGVETWELDQLLALTRGIHRRRQGGPAERRRATEQHRSYPTLAGLTEALEVFISGMPGGHVDRRPPTPPAPVDREEAVALWARLSRYPAAQQHDLIAEVADFQAWALAELLCDQSLAADPDQALALTDLALRIAARSPDGPATQSRRMAYAWAHRGNALLGKGDLKGAEQALRTARQLWPDGARAGALAEERLLRFEATLREEQARTW
jgi:transcriptional regulator with XRE-family HTH domain